MTKQHIVEKDESFRQSEAVKPTQRSDFPFGHDERMIMCDHCDELNGLIHVDGDQRYGVFALAHKGKGIFATFDAEGLREMATTMIMMANYLDDAKVQ